jgi:hypothetical protein
MSEPITRRTPPDRYLREVRAYGAAIPDTLNYLRPRTRHHHHAMIAAFGIAYELEPGTSIIDQGDVKGVHLTLLAEDGLGKAAVENPKITIGKNSSGWPICIAPPNDLLGLVITEGIEDALSIHEATGLGAWAAGSATRLPKLADRVPRFLDTVTVLADIDEVGRRQGSALQERLRTLGFHCELVMLASR